MATGKQLLLGITELGIMHTDKDPTPDLDTRFAMVSESGVYDYYDKTPEDPAEADAYLAASEKYKLPIRAGGWFYTLGRDEGLLKEKLELSARLGSHIHNTQIMWDHADGHAVTNDEVAEFYLEASEWGDKCGCHPAFEVHINMWSEDFSRVNEVADLVEKRGVPYRMTLDHSHVMFKIDNPSEQKIRDITPALADGSLILEPDRPGNVCSQWIDRGLVWHCHARAAVPNNPKNTFDKHPDGSVGRGVQYPFIRPEPGQYVEAWDETRLEPFKLVLCNLMKYHATHEDSGLGQISTEFIPRPDYGGGHGYSIFDNAVACAKWIKSTWQEISAAS